MTEMLRIVRRNLDHLQLDYPEVGPVENLVAALNEAFPNEIPNQITGYVNLQNRETTWQIAAILDKQTRQGQAVGFLINEKIIFFKYDNIFQLLTPKMEIRWRQQNPK